MRKINLSDYQAPVFTEEGLKEVPYKVVDSLITLLFNPELRLNSKQLLENDELARKIMCSGKEVLLEETEYQKLRQAVETTKGYGRNDVELVRRILDAPEIQVEEKKQKEEIK